MDVQTVETTQLSVLPNYTGVWDTPQITHLLKRVKFGTNQAEIAQLKQLTTEQAVDLLLTVSPVPTPPINNYDTVSYPDTSVNPGEIWVNAPYVDGTINGRRRSSLKAWWMGNLLNQNLSINEKMLIFWHNHFSIETDVVSDARIYYRYIELLRQFELGNFKDFVKAITLNPAMLQYLNGNVNTKTAPDENYGRELQELFTIGKGPNSKYTEADVKAAAKVLTGYRINNTTLNYYFDASRHETSNKQFSEFYANTTVVGRTGTDGEKELDDLLSMIFAQNEVALFIVRKLYRFFVYYTIDDATEQSVIAPLAAIFRQNNFEIKPVLRALFLSDHFYSSPVLACYIKTPLDLTAGLCREFSIAFTDTSDYVRLYGLWAWIHTQSVNQNMELGNPPNVAGWQVYYQEPGFYQMWITADTLPKRNQFANTMLSAGYSFSGKKIIIDTIAFAKTLSNPSDPNALINDSLAILYRYPMSLQDKESMKQDILLKGQTTDSYWTDAWNAYIAAPTNTAKVKTVTDILKLFYDTLLRLPEYQLI